MLVTGAAGNVGGALCRALAADYFVVGLDRSEDAVAHDAIAFDLTSDSSVDEALRTFRARYGGRIASVIHLAAYFDFTGEDSPLYQEVNIEGTQRLLRALQDFEVGQFIFSSTMLVHKPCDPGERITEAAPIRPRWVYPQSKADAEAVIRAEHGAIPTVILRLAGLYDDETAVPTLSHQIKRIYERGAKSHLYSGDLRVGQATVHKSDMVEAFRLAVKAREELPEFTELLIGEADVMSYDSLQDELGRLIHGESEWKTLKVPKPLARAGAWAEEHLEPVIPDAIDQGEKPFIRPFMISLSDDHYALDIARARELLGWEPRRKLAETLPGMVSKLKQDPAGWYEANGITPPPWLQAAAGRVDSPDRLRRTFEGRFRKDHAQFLWMHFGNVALGCWLLVAPAVLGYQSAAMGWSDRLTGAVIIVLALATLSWRLAMVRWASAVAGLWLLLAPLVFWAPSAAAYLNGTLLGALVIGFAVAARPAPSVSMVAAMSGPTIPPGWTASPSSWFQRLPIIGLAFVGLFCSLYMASYQLGYVESIWDPFFGGGEAASGTVRVITSEISEAFPVPDAGLGAVVYMLEILLGLIGSNQRWRTMPWVVAAFGLLIVPLGIVSILFIVIQPILIGTWCALCLIAAAAMLLQIAYSANELVATGQFLQRRRAAGKPLLRVFFAGDIDDGAKTGKADDFERRAADIVRDVLAEGVGTPWNLLMCLAVGIWLMFTRVTLGADGAMANADHLIGALVVTISAIALAEVARAVRYLNLLPGLALLVTPFVYGADTGAAVASLLCGTLLIAGSLRRGPVRSRYGSWDRRIV